MKIFLCVVLLLAGIFIVINPAAVSEAVGGAVNDCLEIIIPSLFAFTVLAVFLQNSGLYRSVLKPLNFLLSKILRIDEELCGVFVLSNVGGYPVGAKLLSQLVSSGRISPEDGGKMLCCCYASGPSFVIGIVGMQVFGSVGAGLVIFVSCFLANLILAVIIRLFGKITLKPSENSGNVTAECFVNSVMSAAKVMFTVCVMITAFSVITLLLNSTGVGELWNLTIGKAGTNGEAVFPALLEVSRLKNIKPSPGAMPLCGALLAAGGGCVMLQVAAVGRNLPKKLFLITRIPAALLSAGIVFIAERIFPQETDVLSGNMTAAPFSGNAVLSLSVIMMTVILLWETRQSHFRE